MRWRTIAMVLLGGAVFNLGRGASLAQDDPAKGKLSPLQAKQLEKARLCNNEAFKLRAQGQYVAAQPLFQQALDIFREVLGEKHVLTAICYNELATNLNALGQYTAAQPLYQKALDIRRELLGEKHPATAVSYNNLGFNRQD